MQGGKPSQVSYGSRSGYTNVKPIINGFLKDLLVGPVGDAGGNLLNFIVPGLGVTFDIVANFWDPATYAVDGIIDVAEGKLQALNEMAVAKEAKEAIGPDGELIQNIKAHPEHKPGPQSRRVPRLAWSRTVPRSGTGGERCPNGRK